MDLSTKVFGEFCVACALTVVGVLSLITVVVLMWVMYIN